MRGGGRVRQDSRVTSIIELTRIFMMMVLAGTALAIPVLWVAGLL